jgi:NADPH:quinone reductase-like Zn-dependent oxidoreductase
MSLHLQALYQALQPTAGSPRDESARLADRRTALLYFMKAHSQLLIIAICMAALLFTGAALAQTPSPSVAPRMKAIVYHNYGSPDVLRLEEIEKLVPNDNQVLVKVRAASVNPLDWHYMEGTPYIVRLIDSGLLKPKVTRLGVDFAGTVEAVGKNVTQFKPGDEVFGGKTGAFAEYVCVLADRAVVLKPANITFEQAASVPIAAITALQGLRDKGKVQPGQKVLINGASGGVGTFAVQVAKSFGADVTGVCSTRNVDMVRSIGADRVIDYTKEDFTKSGQRYDLILDNVGNHSLLECRRALNPKGKYVMIGGGGSTEQGFIGPLVNPIKALVLAPFVSQQMGMMLAQLNKKDLTILGDLMQAGKIKPVIDRTYTLSQLPEAIRYLEQGHARGKVVITVEDNPSPIGANRAANSVSTIGPLLIALEFFTAVIGVTIVPIVVALALNRRFRRRNPEKRPYRWGYYFSILSFIGAIGLVVILQLGVTAVIVCGVIYAVLAWFFAQRDHWAWITLTILSFNPVAWIINFIYLRRRWAEDSVAAPTI